VAVVGFSGATIYVILAMENGALGPMQWLWALGILLAGLSVGAGMWALSWLVRIMYELRLFQQHMLVQASHAEPPRPAKPAWSVPSPRVATPIEQEQAQLLAKMTATLEEIHLNLMLTPAQREAKRLRLHEQKSAQLADEVATAIDSRDFVQAQAMLDKLVSQIPDDGKLPVLKKQLDDARADAQAKELGEQTRLAKDLMAVGDFVEAARVAQELAKRYPALSEAKELSQTVAREAAAFGLEQRTRLYAEVEHAARSRRWRQALATGKRLLQLYPGSEQADAVAAQIPTLEENARLEEVRELRDRIRDLLERRRFNDAISLAQDVIKRFPDTHAAAELSSQMDKLAELAKSSADAVLGNR
jgi:tetratricopeptide (TPR) repeat protein